MLIINQVITVTVAKQPYCCYALGMYRYGNTSCQVGHLLLIETCHTILANQISITCFCQGILTNKCNINSIG